VSAKSPGNCGGVIRYRRVTGWRIAQLLDHFVDAGNISIVFYLFTFSHNLFKYNNISCHRWIVGIRAARTEARKINAERGTS
jgi:hypothetical protein